MLTLYARKEPTQDSVLHQYAPGVQRFDVVFYKDRSGSDRYATWEWFKTPPRLGQRTVTLNCYRWNVVWLDSLRTKSEAR